MTQKDTAWVWFFESTGTDQTVQAVAIDIDEGHAGFTLQVAPRLIHRRFVDFVDRRAEDVAFVPLAATE